MANTNDIENPALEPAFTYNEGVQQQARQPIQEVSSGAVRQITEGGTGADNPTDARSNLGAAASGANNDITDLRALTEPLKIDGDQVVKGRITGWGACAGTLDRTGFTAVDTGDLPIGAAYTQAEVEALRDHVVILSQALAAILADLNIDIGGHGLIGS